MNLSTPKDGNAGRGAIRLQGLKKNYKDQAVVHGINLEVNPGEFIVLVGPSGCGKSTTLRMIAGLEEITSGDLFIDGVRANDTAPKNRNIAMVFQNYALYPHMNVFGNMAFALKLRGDSEAQVKSRVSEVAKSLGLEELLDRKPGQLSGGQRQRVAMGRAIVRNPSAFLFDEPLSNLDANLRTQMRAEIKKLHHRMGVTILYVTHDQVEAMTLADRIVVMNQGRIEQVGTPTEVYQNPANTFVASFMGSPPMSLLQGLKPGDTKTLFGVRPESVSLKPGSADDCIFPVEIDLVETLGARTLIHGTYQGQRVAAWDQNPGPSSLKMGSKVQFSLPWKDVLHFDSATGQARNA